LTLSLSVEAFDVSGSFVIEFYAISLYIVFG